MEQNKPAHPFTFSLSDQSHGDQPANNHPIPTIGDPCPRCGKAALDYNGLLQVTCPHCGYRVEGGAFT